MSFDEIGELVGVITVVTFKVVKSGENICVRLVLQTAKATKNSNIRSDVAPTQSHRPVV
jgi:hypothetical protein